MHVFQLNWLSLGTTKCNTKTDDTAKTELHKGTVHVERESNAKGLIRGKMSRYNQIIKAFGVFNFKILAIDRLGKL